MVYGEWKDDYTLSMALGGLTNGTNVRDMAEAYAVFPNGGYYSSSRTFTRVTQVVNGEEKLLFEMVPEEDPVIRPTTAWYMNNMLQGVFTSGGTAGGKGIRGQHAAGKTGTTSDDKDRWFAGYTPYYTAVVWCGYNRPYKINTDFNPALRLWNQIMTKLHEGLPDKDYSDPGGRRTVVYCQDSGLLATEYCAMDPRGSRAASGSVFPESYPEQNYCPYHTEEGVITICMDRSAEGVYHLAGEFCPEDRRASICPPKYERVPMGRRMLYKLTELCVKEGKLEEAESYFDEFQKIAPNDIGKLLLAYQIEAAKDGDLNKMITILELYRKNEFEERWAYELAHLYHRAGRVKECVQLCNEIIL